jgi:hypothetical protein
MKYKRLFESDVYKLTYQDIKKGISKILFKDMAKGLKRLLDNYEEHPDWYDYMLDLFPKAVNKALKIANLNLYEVEQFYLLNELNSYLESDDYYEKISDYFPIVLYINATGKKGDSIGILVFENGKIELFEGNDEASPETYELLDKVLKDTKPLRVYCMQDRELAVQIETTKIAPEGLYVSPDRKYAEGYWSLSQDRILFAFTINPSDVRKESDVDWKMKAKTKIKHFYYV